MAQKESTPGKQQKEIRGGGGLSKLEGAQKFWVAGRGGAKSFPYYERDQKV